MEINVYNGFYGCLDLWDCKNWTWKNCPNAWEDNFYGKYKKPTVVLEVILDEYLWMWAAYFGSPGSLNNIIILDTS